MHSLPKTSINTSTAQPKTLYLAKDGFVPGVLTLKIVLLPERSNTTKDEGVSVFPAGLVLTLRIVVPRIVLNPRTLRIVVPGVLTLRIVVVLTQSF